jgi:hypothetical protein
LLSLLLFSFTVLLQALAARTSLEGYWQGTLVREGAILKADFDFRAAASFGRGSMFLFY